MPYEKWSYKVNELFKKALKEGRVPQIMFKLYFPPSPDHCRKITDKLANLHVQGS